MFRMMGKRLEGLRTRWVGSIGINFREIQWLVRGRDFILPILNP
jgi:hypothetical protein